MLRRETTDIALLHSVIVIRSNTIAMEHNIAVIEHNSVTATGSTNALRRKDARMIGNGVVSHGNGVASDNSSMTAGD